MPALGLAKTRFSESDSTFGFRPSGRVRQAHPSSGVGKKSEKSRGVRPAGPPTGAPESATICQRVLPLPPIPHYLQNSAIPAHYWPSHSFQRSAAIGHRAPNLPAMRKDLPNWPTSVHPRRRLARVGGRRPWPEGRGAGGADHGRMAEWQVSHRHTVSLRHVSNRHAHARPRT